MKNKVSPRYNRSEIVSFYELSRKQQEDAVSNANSKEDAENDRYVFFNEGDGSETALHLSMFMRLTNCKVWDGIYCTSYFSAYLIKINKSGDQVLIAEQFT